MSDEGSEMIPILSPDELTPEVTPEVMESLLINENKTMYDDIVKMAKKVRAKTLDDFIINH